MFFSMSIFYRFGEGLGGFWGWFWEGFGGSLAPLGQFFGLFFGCLHWECSLEGLLQPSRVDFGSILRALRAPEGVQERPKRGSWALLALILPHFFAFVFNIDFSSNFLRFRRGFGRVLGGQNGPKIEIFGIFLDVLVETLFFVDFW